MSYIIDRRLNSRNKNAVNRQRFMRRYKSHIQKAVQEAIKQRSITDMERGEDVAIPASDVDEPTFSHGSGGRRSIVHPGNKEFIAGDRVPRPSGGGGGGGSSASDSGEGDDDFVFQLTQDEFLDVMFEDLELPNLVKRHLRGADSFKRVHAGFLARRRAGETERGAFAARRESAAHRADGRLAASRRANSKTISCWQKAPATR